MESLQTKSNLQTSGMRRLDSLDSWRGLMIVLMMLDHVREFFNRGALTATPTEAGHTTILLYATRWITHLCAPTFLLLAGVGIRLQRENRGPSTHLTRFLVTRGVWLIFLDLTVVSAALNFGRPFLFLQVLYATGMSMVAMGVLVWLSPGLVLVLGSALVFVSPLANLAFSNKAVPASALLTLALWPGALPGRVVTVVLYPFLPWLGIMCLGYGVGHVFLLSKELRTRIIVWIAMCCLLGFFLVRALNRFGDPSPWKFLPSVTNTIESFLNVTKYPPSLDYALATLGLSLLLYLALDRFEGKSAAVLLTMGRTPLFTYLVHFVVLHCLQIVIGVSLGFPLGIFENYIATAMRGLSGQGSAGVPEAVQLGWGFPLWGSYGIWLVIVGLVYPLSRWFSNVKSTSNRWWIRYL